jgi:hypothetical protein
LGEQYNGEKPMSDPTTNSEAKATRDTPAAAKAPTGDELAVVQERALQSLEATGTAMLAGLTKAQKQFSDFVAERIRQDVEAQAELLGCRTLEDVRDVQARFFKTAMDQYATEATKLMQIGVEMMAPAPKHIG